MLDYIQITKEDFVLWNMDLKPSSLVLLMFLIFVHNQIQETSWHGQQGIVKATGLSKHTITRSLQELEKYGYASVIRKGHKSNTVRLNTAKLAGMCAKMASIRRQIGRPKDNTGRTIKEVSNVNEFGFIQTN